MIFESEGFHIFGIFKLLIMLAVVVTPVVLLLFLVLRKKRGNSENNIYRPQKEPVDRKVVMKEKGAHYDEERKRILTMIDNGKISAEEASRLLNALERETTTMDCPFCGGEIRIEAKKCKHCGAFFKDPFATETRRLTKSRDVILTGACGGLAEYLGLDPMIVRVITALVILTTGIITGMVVYLIASLIIPDPE